MKITEHIKKLISDVALKANKTELENKANVTDLANISTTSKTISNVIENADLTISNTVDIKAKLTHLYTGNGGTNALNLGVGFIDFTQNNSVGAWLDRSGGAGTFGTFKDDSNNTITSFDIALPQDKFIGAFDIKERSTTGGWDV